MIGRRVIDKNDAIARPIVTTMSLKTKMMNTTMTQRNSEFSMTSTRLPQDCFNFYITGRGGSFAKCKTERGVTEAHRICPQGLD